MAVVQASLAPTFHTSTITLFSGRRNIKISLQAQRLPSVTILPSPGTHPHLHTVTPFSGRTNIIISLHVAPLIRPHAKDLTSVRSTAPTSSPDADNRFPPRPVCNVIPHTSQFSCPVRMPQASRISHRHHPQPHFPDARTSRNDLFQ